MVKFEIFNFLRLLERIERMFIFNLVKSLELARALRQDTLR